MTKLNHFLLGIGLSVLSGLAFAAKYKHTINWSETPDSIYYIEISEGQPDNIIEKKVIKESSFELLTDRAGVYFWRYRSKTNNKWGPYSGYTPVTFKDSSVVENKALMIFPLDGEEVLYKNNKLTVDFTWDEVDSESVYFLELYFDKKEAPSRVMSVSGGRFSLKLKKIPEQLYWRVFRKKKNGEFVYNNKKKFEVKLFPAREEFKPSENFLLNLNISQAQSAFSFDAPTYKKDESFTGQMLEFNGEYFPKFWKRKRSVNFYFRNTSFAKDDLEVSNKKFGLEFGLSVGDDPSVHHQFYLGYQFINTIEMSFGTELETDYDQGFFTGRYLYRNQFSNRFAVEMNAGLQLGSFSTVPSFILRPGLNFLLKENLWLTGFGFYEKYLSEIDDSSRSATVTIEQTNNGIGLGVTWIPGRK